MNDVIEPGLEGIRLAAVFLFGCLVWGPGYFLGIIAGTFAQGLRRGWQTAGDTYEGMYG